MALDEAEQDAWIERERAIRLESQRRAAAPPAVIVEAVAGVVDVGEIDTPLDYLLAVVRHPNETPARRMAAAEKAAPYVHPKLAHTVIEDRSAVDMKALLDDIRAERVRLGRPVIELEAIEMVEESADSLEGQTASGGHPRAK